MTAVLTAPTAALPATVGADLEVPLVDGRRVRHVDLDAAASAPPLQAVADHVVEVLPYYASVHRGAGYTSRVCTSLLESARETVGRFLGAREDDVVVFTRNTTDALALLARAVPGPVLTLDLEHHATLLAWRHTEHRVVTAGDTVAATLDALREHVGGHALVAVTGASNVTGETLPLREIADLAHAAGARVAVDAAQLAPHRRVDLAALGVDYVALSGHKLYAPYGAGVLVGRRDWLDAAPAHLAGGGAVRAVSVTGDVTGTDWLPAPQRHEGGTPNMLGAAALAAACRALEPVIDTVLPEHERELAERLRRGLAGIPGVRTLDAFSDAPDRVAVVTLEVGPDGGGLPAGLVAAALSAEHGIGVRDGRFCAHPLLARLTGGRDAVRASLGLATTAEDVDRFVAAIATIVAHGPAWTYALRDGRWVPTPDPRDLDPFRLGDHADPAGCGR
ncbi:aminotransferase class V-fold PLP-dependent enzyme [Actinomycetospora aeridis]|uniref:Aminotransferase class V-fold PLP-dependent enzyme n=1 Tax=Actinomycetospora aeridis TaxID=3129231 RepID=A0ABU8NCY6_9PSEU